MNDKKTASIILLLLVCDVALAAYFIFMRPAKLAEKTAVDFFATSTLPTPWPQDAALLLRERETPPDGYCYSDAVITQLPVRNDNTTVWTTYHNSRYGYTLSYPDTGCLYARDVHYINVTDGAQGPGYIAVSATSTTLTLDAWLQNQVREFSESASSLEVEDSMILGRTLKVAGYDAVSTHLSNVDGLPYVDSPSAQQTVYILKDGVVYGIWTRGINAEDVRTRFTFDK